MNLLNSDITHSLHNTCTYSLHNTCTCITVNQLAMNAVKFLYFLCFTYASVHIANHRYSVVKMSLSVDSFNSINNCAIFTIWLSIYVLVYTIFSWDYVIQYCTALFSLLNSISMHNCLSLS